MGRKRILFNPFEMRLSSRIIISGICTGIYLIAFTLAYPAFSGPTYAFLMFPAMMITIYWGLLAGCISTGALFVISYFVLSPGGGDAVTSSYIPPMIVFVLGLAGAGFLRGLLKQIVEREGFHKAVMDYTYDSEYWINPQGKLQYQSDSIRRITGYEPEYFRDKQHNAFLDIVFEDDKVLVDTVLNPDNNTTDEVATCEYRIVTKSGTIKWLETTARKIYDEDGTYLGYRGSTRDITERKLIQEALAESERLYRTIVSNANSAIIEYNMAGEISFFNKYAETLFGYTADEVIGKKGVETINKTENEELPDMREMLEGILTNTGEYTYNENKNFRKDGSELWVAWTNAPLFDNKGNKTGILCIGNDITRQKTAEETVRARLEEKDILLREIHHRVKNNLQIISSMLSLQRETLADPESRNVFKNCEHRISSMALVHDNLYHSDNIARIDIRDYVSALTGTIIDSYHADPGSLELQLELEEIYLNIDQAIPCGLILTELITNSLKYALQPSQGTTGQLNISISTIDGAVNIDLQDNGPGFDSAGDWRNTGSLGLKLVDALTDQLGAKVSLDGSGGTRWQILFKIAEG